MKDKTTIIISHRVSSVKNADSIIVIENGCVIEQGKAPRITRKTRQLFQFIQNAAVRGREKLVFTTI
jgi:ABC-type multidrug transport system fused ATPase/permease subunit